LRLPPGRHVELPGRGRTFVREAGDGGPTLLLLHGWTATSDLNWFGCYDALAASHRIVALDHRGHGRGIRAGASFRLHDCADDAAALVETLGLGPVVVVGYSMGGAVAQLLWRRHPELVSGLVLCATSRHFLETWRERRHFAILAAGAVSTRFLPRPWTAELITHVVSSRSTAGPFEGWAADELRRNDWVAVLEAGHRLLAFDSRPWAGSIDVPTAVVTVMHDSMVPTRRQLGLARAIRGTTVHPVQGDHTVCGTHPERFTPVLLAAIASVTARAAATTAEP
jgi:3-oxoadipate enol-lactonase